MPNKHGVINFTIPTDMKATIEQIAKKRGVSEGALCRYALSHFLEKEA